MATVSRTHHDVVVVGARCAGAATAMHLARSGHDVVVIDKAELPRDTVSTHAIARGGVVQLERWGLLDDVLASGTPAIRQVTFRAGEEETTRRVKNRAGVDMLVAPRRQVLDGLLGQAAVRAGAELRTGVTARGVERDDDGRVSGVWTRDAAGDAHRLTARFVVGADGLRSRMAGHVGAPVLDESPSGTSVFYTYVADADWRGFEFHVAPDAFAGVFPTHAGEACVWLCRPARAATSLRAAGADRVAALLTELDQVSPDLAARVRTGRVTAPVRGIAAPANQIRQPVGPGWALVGDAGYHLDPITGHGMTDAFRDAELLAVALDRSLREPAGEAASMAAFHEARDAALRETFGLTAALSTFPAPDRFVALQMQLSQALEREALLLASLPGLQGEEVDASAA